MRKGLAERICVIFGKRLRIGLAHFHSQRILRSTQTLRARGEQFLAVVRSISTHFRAPIYAARNAKNFTEGREKVRCAGAMIQSSSF
jgi:hypothetical protein